MKKAMVLFFAVVIGLSFAFTGFAQEKKAAPAAPAAKVEAPAPVEKEKPAKKEKKVKKVKKEKKVEGAPAEEKPAEKK
jgi:hypothetical protein